VKNIRALSPEDAGAYQLLRREALEDAPFAFGSSPEDDRARSIDFVRAMLADPDQRICGAFVPHLAGIVGIYRDRHAKSAHKAHLWGLYVQPAQRGAGLGRALVESALEFARSLDGVTQVHLSVSDEAPSAAALYRLLGFVTWGIEPAALRVGGHDIAEHHMVLSWASPP
jgi:ribosomal protein S18 acetylase RimI-like enzyme